MRHLSWGPHVARPLWSVRLRVTIQDHGKPRNRRRRLLVPDTSCVPRNTSSFSTLGLLDTLDALDESQSDLPRDCSVSSGLLCALTPCLTDNFLHNTFLIGLKG